MRRQREKIFWKQTAFSLLKLRDNIKFSLESQSENFDLFMFEMESLCLLQVELSCYKLWDVLQFPLRHASSEIHLDYLRINFHISSRSEGEIAVGIRSESENNCCQHLNSVSFFHHTSISSERWYYFVTIHMFVVAGKMRLRSNIFTMKAFWYRSHSIDPFHFIINFLIIFVSQVNWYFHSIVELGMKHWRILISPTRRCSSAVWHMKNQSRFICFAYAEYQCVLLI